MANNRVGQRAIDMTKDNLNELDSNLTQAEAQLRSAGVPLDQVTQTRDNIRQFQAIPSEVLVAPFDAQIVNITPQPPTIVSYFTPAAIALVIQHLAVTLASLSMVRARMLGTTQLWQTAPVRLGEIVAGNYLSYGILVLAAGAVLIFAVTWALAVPVLGPVPYLWLSVVLLVLASLGIGFAISLIAKSEQSAAQMAMITLLASIFLGGFVLPLEQVTFPVRIVSYLLPATYAGQLFQSLMVRGEQGDPLYYVALGLIALVGLILTVRLFRRELKPS